MKQHCVNTRVCWIAKRIIKPSRLPQANTTHQPNAGSKLVPRRRLWPTTIQHWTVLSVGGGVSTDYKLTPNKSWVNVAHIQRGAKHDTVTQYWANVVSASQTVGQH